MSAVSDPHAKHWLADDPNFLASLGDLDRGLAESGEDDAFPDGDSSSAIVAPAPPHVVATEPGYGAGATRPPRARGGTAPLNPSRILNQRGAAAMDGLDLPADSSLPPAETRVRGPLLDLFPASALVDERPPNPTLGTAVGPQLPPSRARAVPRAIAPGESSPAPLRDAEPPPSQLEGLTYETFYGLREKPFSLSSDPKFLYPSAAHERAAQA